MTFHKLCHSDWGKDPKKRWMCRAELKGETWIISLPEAVGEPESFFKRVSGGAPTLFGFDFPIGFPEAYAASIDCKTYRQVLEKLRAPKWEPWFNVCEDQSQISKYRPFYPYHTGNKKQAHLTEAHGVKDMKALHRRCELMSKAGSMFWTLGGKQVGKGMIAGLQELILPHLEDIAIWPFDGTLSDLSKGSKSVVCETYPGAAYEMFGIDRHKLSKTQQASRKDTIASILHWQKNRPVKFSVGLKDLIEDGFGHKKNGEDQFDAFIGLMKMMDVNLGFIPEITEKAVETLGVEGWILGLQDELPKNQVSEDLEKSDGTDGLSTLQIGAAGELLVQYQLLLLGIESSRMTTDAGIDLVAYSSKSEKAVTIQVKTCLKSKPSGGKGRPLLNWWLRKNSPAELVALVDLSADRVWLFEHSDFETRCQQKNAKSNMMQLYFYTETDYKAKQGSHLKDFQGDLIATRAPALLGY